MSKTGKKAERRILAIGDVHGCARELSALLKKMKISRDDLIVFLGDYVDRGPDSRQVVDIILDLSTDHEVVTLKGNHEALFLDFLDQPESPGAGLFVLNGGASTLANYAFSDGSIEIPESHMKFFRELKLWHETDEYFFVHAGVPLIPLDQINAEEHELLLLWSRQPFLSTDYQWSKLIVHGHTPVRDVEVYPNRINVDTGCVYDGKLTAVEFPAAVFHHVEKGIKNEAPIFPRESQSDRVTIRYSGQIPIRVGRLGEEKENYRTLNYNQFGLLMQPGPGVGEVKLRQGDLIEGVIGDDPAVEVKFQGEIVRIESRGPNLVFGVRIDRVAGDIGGPEWIKRPA